MQQSKSDVEWLNAPSSVLLWMFTNHSAKLINFSLVHVFTSHWRMRVQVADGKIRTGSDFFSKFEDRQTCQEGIKIATALAFVKINKPLFYSICAVSLHLLYLYHTTTTTTETFHI